MEAQEVPRPPPRLEKPHRLHRRRRRAHGRLLRWKPSSFVALYGEPRGMTGTGSGDAARELLGLDEAGDTAPPDIRNGPQERLGASAGVNLGEPAREREAAPRHVACGNPSVAWTRERA